MTGRNNNTHALLVAFALLAMLPGHLPAITFAELMRGEPWEEAVYATRGESRLLLYVFRPHSSGKKPLPALVLIHGGGWIGGTPDAFMHLARYFASRGMVVFNITYRLMNPQNPQSSTIADAVEDCREAMRFIRRNAEKYAIDPDKIAVLGDSAGGHLAAALETLPRNENGVSSRPNALLLFNPVLDLTDGDWIRFAVGGSSLSKRDQTPRPSSSEAIAAARALSPAFHVCPGQNPMLLVHGRGDRVVDVAQAERFAAAAQKAGNRCDLILLGDDIGHAFVIPAYKSPEPVVVGAVRSADQFLASLGWIFGEPTLLVSEIPAFEPIEP